MPPVPDPSSPSLAVSAGESSRSRRRPAVALRSQTNESFTISCGVPDSSGGIFECDYDEYRPGELQMLPEDVYPPSPRIRSLASRSNGCGARVHSGVAMVRRSQSWIGSKDGIEPTVIPLDSVYFTSEAETALGLQNGGTSPCGCAAIGLGCAVCGNPLGAMNTYCRVHAMHRAPEDFVFLTSAVTAAPSTLPPIESDAAPIPEVYTVVPPPLPSWDDWVPSEIPPSPPSGSEVELLTPPRLPRFAELGFSNPPPAPPTPRLFAPSSSSPAVSPFGPPSLVPPSRQSLLPPSPQSLQPPHTGSLLPLPPLPSSPAYLPSPAAQAAFGRLRGTPAFRRSLNMPPPSSSSTSAPREQSSASAPHNPRRPLDMVAGLDDDTPRPHPPAPPGYMESINAMYRSHLRPPVERVPGAGASGAGTDASGSSASSTIASSGSTTVGNTSTSMMSAPLTTSASPSSISARIDARARIRASTLSGGTSSASRTPLPTAALPSAPPESPAAAALPPPRPHRRHTLRRPGSVERYFNPSASTSLLAESTPAADTGGTHRDVPAPPPTVRRPRHPDHDAAVREMFAAVGVDTNSSDSSDSSDGRTEIGEQRYSWARGSFRRPDVSAGGTTQPPFIPPLSPFVPRSAASPGNRVHELDAELDALGARVAVLDAAAADVRRQVESLSSSVHAARDGVVGTVQDSVGASSPDATSTVDVTATTDATDDPHTDLVVSTRLAIAAERERLIAMQTRMIALTNTSPDASASTPSSGPTPAATSTAEELRTLLQQQTALLARVSGLVSDMTARVGEIQGGVEGTARTLLVRAQEALERADAAAPGLLARTREVLVRADSNRWQRAEEHAWIGVPPEAPSSLLVAESRRERAWRAGLEQLTRPSAPPADAVPAPVEDKPRRRIFFER
ncbi:hypothetical protein C8R43DRAFT_1048743 [Mycena crocata]|nr:hypothetical protein C8R43DRAFT_1048743 [Mycena crocata]